MTSNSAKLLLCALLVVPLTGAWAALGEHEGSITTERMRMGAAHAVSRRPQYAVHELRLADGSRVREYVGGTGMVFAVSWNTRFKPDLPDLLGNSFRSYANATQEAARSGGLQRQFRHQSTDLILQSNGHLNVYSGYAYRPSLLPPGMSLQQLAMG